MDFGHLVAGPPSLKVARGHSGQIFDTFSHAISTQLAIYARTIASSPRHGSYQRIKWKLSGLECCDGQDKPFKPAFWGDRGLAEAILVH